MTTYTIWTTKNGDQRWAGPALEPGVELELVPKAVADELAGALDGVLDGNEREKAITLLDRYGWPKPA